MKDNVLQQKSFEFAVLIVNLSRKISSEKKEFMLSRQLLKSGTGIGANVEESIGGHSRADFFAKITIAYKEAIETSYWIKLLFETNLIEQDDFDRASQLCDEICRILASIQKTTKNS